MANIVVFGKAQSGKSTLLGYLRSELDKDFNIDNFELQVRAELGRDYEPSYLYAYIMDQGKDERKKRKGTRNIHVRRIPFINNNHITVIDTPGAEHEKLPRQKGVYLGDIGVFCLELSDVISDDFMFSSRENSTILSTLLLWSNLGHKNIIVALTKCDKVNYSENDYLIAKERVISLCGRTKISHVTVIPISIIVSQKKGFNITRKAQEFSWYQEDTLFDTLIHKVKDLGKPQKGELLFSIYNQIDKPSSQAGKVWMIKILQGELSINDNIVISPVLTKNRDFLSINATVKTIRGDLHETEENESIATAAAGEIVGIDLKNIYCSRGKLEKKDFDTIYTTCGFNRDVDYNTSDIFCFTVDIKYETVFQLNREFSLIWFGRRITFSVHKPPAITENSLYIIAKIKSRKLSLPKKADGEYYFTKLIIRDENNKLLDPYYEGTLISVGMRNI